MEFIYPTSSVRRGLADPGDNLLLPIEVEHQFKSLTIYAEGGYVWNESAPMQGWFGLAGKYELSEKFSLMAEFYGGYDREFRDSGMSFNLGLAGN